MKLFACMCGQVVGGFVVSVVRLDVCWSVWSFVSVVCWRVRVLARALV